MFLLLPCQILKQSVQNPAWLTSVNAGNTTLLSCTGTGAAPVRKQVAKARKRTQKPPLL